MKSPNVILISIDTLRADHLSCYGYHRATSPNIDGIAREGVLYENCSSTAAWTPPAHASMLTGLYPSQHGVVRDNRLSHEVPTVAEVLCQNRYRTAGFVNNSQVGELVGLDRGHTRFDEVWKGLGRNRLMKRLIHKVKAAAGLTDKGAAETNQRALHWMDSVRNGNDPFYMFIHYIETHNPLRAPGRFRSRYLDSKRQQSLDMEKLWKVAHNPLVCFTENILLTAAEQDALACLYDEEIAYVDSIIGELTGELRRRGILDDTVLIITADHGEHLGEHGLYSHAASLYAPITHIPLIVRYPARFTPGRRDDSLVQLTDIFPTILELTAARFAGAKDLPGRSLLSVPDDERFAIAEWEGRIPHFVRAKGCGKATRFDESFFMERINTIRQGSLKYVARSKGADELYDLANDPGERFNLIPSAGDVGESLRSRLESCMAAMSPAVLEERRESEAVKKNLEALGYM